MSKTLTFTPLDETEFLELEKTLLPALVPLEQSPSWGKFNTHIAGREYLGSFKYEDKSGKLLAIATAVLYKDRGRNWIWIKHGPVFADEPNTKTIQKMCATLKQQFSNLERANPIFIRLSSSIKTAPLGMPFEHTMYDETIVLDLTQSEDELFMGLSKSGRQDVRKAQKNNVVVKEIPANSAEFFAQNCYPILQETASRDGFGIHPLSVYTAMLKNLAESRLYVALYNGKVEAWAITTEYNSQALYYYGASSARARETCAAYGLQWEIIKALKSRGIKTYDLMGIAGQHFPALRNVTGFKMKFSKNIVKVPITYDLPLQPVKYHLLSLAIKAKRKFSRS
jgi:peptidoglycan biosynthesis/recognition FemAB-like protein